VKYKPTLIYNHCIKQSISLRFVLVFAFLLFWQFSFTQEIKSNWQFRQVGTSIWHKATVPGTVHTDLLNNKLIEDPFYRDNETKLQWVSQANWEYKTSFDIDAETFAKKHIELHFEGLDTYAMVYFNGKPILQANNMFRTWVADIKPFAKRQHNQLMIVFKSTDKMADSLANISPTRLPCENNRNFVRKAQYHFGWDFAPKLTTCGIWRKVSISSWDKEKQLSYVRISWGINLIQQKDSIGQSFYFTKNNKPIFIKGANWVPADVFLPRITKTKYRNLLVAAKQAGINMLRVWGGGIYEDDYFYTLCDSLHIMVWQDFMFAGAMYPSDSSFLENVKQEAIDNLQRLSKHPCIALWCGNNEIDEAWHNWGWQKQYHFSTADSAAIWNGYQKLFHQILPALVKQYSTQPYITTSPKNGWGRNESMTHGDSHYWGVWWGLQPIETYTKKIPRFMSEYGMQALPNFESIQQFTLPQDWDTASTIMKLHQKHSTGYQNLAVYLNQNKLTSTNFKQYINATQTLQAKALTTAITAHTAAQPRCMGTMFWQFNDCYPGTTWSIIDFYGNKKKAYFVVKQLYNKH
jgi:beta-mannosidase